MSRAAVADAPRVARFRWTRWLAFGVLTAFAVLDLCGRAAPPPPDPAEVAAAAAGAAPGAEVVAFETLAGFECGWPEGEAAFTPPAVPDAVLALAGREVAVTGYVLPTEFEGGLTVRFLLARYPGGCCYGGVVGPHEMIDVVPAAPVDVPTHVPVLVAGRLSIRAPASAADLAAGLYAIEAGVVRPLAD